MQIASIQHPIIKHRVWVVGSVGSVGAGSVGAVGAVETGAVGSTGTGAGGGISAAIVGSLVGSTLCSVVPVNFIILYLLGRLTSTLIRDLFSLSFWKNNLVFMSSICIFTIICLEHME